MGQSPLAHREGTSDLHRVSSQHVCDSKLGAPIPRQGASN